MKKGKTAPKKMACGGKAKMRKMKKGGMVCKGMGAAGRGGKFSRNG